MRGTVVCMLRHAGIVVEDLDREVTFYCEVLGFRVERRMEEKGPFIEHLLDLPGASVTTVKLAPVSGGAMIELVKFHAPAADPRGALTLKTPGPTHVALTVSDLSMLKPKLEAGGGTLVAQPMLSADGRVLAAYCRDPENNFIELVEEL